MAEQQHKNSNSPQASPSMSNAQQKAGQFRQQAVSYPSPTYGESPCITQFNYPPPAQPEPYRESPPGSNSSAPLPSMRSIDPAQQQQQQQQQIATSIPPPVAQMSSGPYYQQPAHNLAQYSNVNSGQNGKNMHFALTPTDTRQTSGGRHKKEIKRRTKTGCLTCRKRRIKCDEQHPACRNCQKSKRECLGYDPIFKQQPGHTAIQPAPSVIPPIGNIAVSSNPYGNQPQLLTSGYGTANITYDQTLPVGPTSSGQGFEFVSAIDPALEGAGPAPAATATVFPNQVPVKRSVSELLSMGGPPPRVSPEETTSATSIDEVKHLYYSIYTPGLENFLETKWFHNKGLAKLLESKPLLDQFFALIQQFAKTDQNDPKEIQYTSNVEARFIWALAGLVRSTAAEKNDTKDDKVVPDIDDPVEASNRLNVFEALLTGKVAASNPLTVPTVVSIDPLRIRELEFWYTLGNFVCIPYEDASATKSVDENLATLRNLLDTRENRDVLYSIAVARGLGQRFSGISEHDGPSHLDESDNKSKLLVAKKFVTSEAAGAGTTNVIRRLCDLASRSWVLSAAKKQ